MCCFILIFDESHMIEMILSVLKKVFTLIFTLNLTRYQKKVLYFNGGFHMLTKYNDVIFFASSKKELHDYHYFFKQKQNIILSRDF